MAHLRRQAAVKTSDKLHDFLMNPRSRPDLQTPAGQRLLKTLEHRFHNEKTDALMPFLTREWKKGRLRHDWLERAFSEHPVARALPDDIQDALRLYHEKGVAPAQDVGANVAGLYDSLPDDHRLMYDNPLIQDGRYNSLLTSGQLDHWADFLNTNHPVRREMPDLMKETLPSLWERVHTWDNAMEQAAHEQALKDGKVVHATPDGWTVRQLTTPEELKAEGDAMGHCVGGYGDYVRNGRSLIYSLRDPEGHPHVTTEIHPNRTRVDYDGYVNHYFDGDWDRAAQDWGLSPARLRDLAQGAPVAPEGTNQYYYEDALRSGLRDSSFARPIPHGGNVTQIQGKGNREPIDEYKARLADWFRSFPPEDRPTKDTDEEPYLHDDDGYGHSRLDHPDLIPVHERELGSLVPQPQGVEDEYGLIHQTGGMLPSDYDDLLSNIKFRDYGSQGSEPDATHIADIYRLARERGEIPDLAKALEGYQDTQQSDFDNWLDMNYEYAPQYPDEPTGWEDEEGEDAQEGDEGARPYWLIRPGSSDPYNDKYYSPEDAENAYNVEYTDWERQHAGMNAVNQMYQLVNPHFGPHPETGEHGFWNELPQPTPPTPSPTEPSQAPQQPGTVSRVAMPIVPTKWDVLNRPRADYVGEMPQYPGDREDFANRRPEWQAWRDAAQPEYDAHRQREEEWDRAARNAMATGRMTPEQVVELGYHPSNHETDGGWGAPKWGRWRPLPERLYHVTSNLPAIAQSGVLRSPHELDLAGKGRGLGGGTQDTISLTDSREEAENIKRAILEGADVASGRLPIERMVEMAANGEGTNKPWLKTMFGNYDWSQGNPQALDDLLLGRKPFYTHLLPEDHPLRQPASGLGGVRSAEEWAQHGYYPYPGAYALGQPGSPMYNERSVYRNLTPEEKAHEAFEWWRNPWASMRSWSGGPSDPIFTGVDSHWFAKLDPSHVGIIEAQPVPGAHGYPLSSLGEWRIPTGEAVNITGINGQPYTPPVTSRTAGDGDGYVTCDQGHQHWGRNGAAGALLRHVDPQGQERYLLTLRSPQVHEGDCWGVPGGALDSHEQPHEAALRETQEELGTLPQVNNLRTLHTNDHGGWAYTTVTGDVAKPFQPDVSGWETTDAGWFTPQEVDQLPLHSGFAQTWQQLRPPRQSKTAVVNAQPLYKRWVYSPASGQVTLSDNSGDPLAVKYHTDLARERNEPNLVHGTAVRIGNGWRLFDWESKPLEDPHIIAQVMAALRTSNGASDPHTASWDPSMDDADWTRVHHGLPS